MFFSKRRKHGGIPSHMRRSIGGSHEAPEEFLIEYDMMLKGATIQRRSRKFRQFAVMVGTDMHLVTSGDVVGRGVYDALLAAKAIKPPAAPLDSSDGPESGARGGDAAGD